MKNESVLSPINSLIDFDKLVEQAIAAVSSKKLVSPEEVEETDEGEFLVRRYRQILMDVETEKDESPAIHELCVQILTEDEAEKDEEPEKALFWIGFEWGRKDNIWLGFDAKTCPAAYWDRLNKLVGTSGEYYSKVDLEFVQTYMNAWINFYLKEEHLKQFYNKNASTQSQKGLLTAFINEVVDKL